MIKNDTKAVSAWDIPLALVLLTRLPIPHLPQAVFQRQSNAAWAFPVVGLVIGLLACAVGWLGAAMSLPQTSCAILVVLTLIVTTGAMHEDGLADTADGLWGGYAPERRLEIMKDSHIGTYGVLALILSQALRVALIVAVVASAGLAGVVAACVTSRAMMPAVMAALPNARASGLSHSVGAPRGVAVMIGAVLATVLALFLVGAAAILPLMVSAAAVAGLCLLAKAKIGGQTGDILGATQQVAELVFLMMIAAQY